MFSAAVRCYEKGGHKPESLVSHHFKVYVCRWRAGFYDKAIETLKEVEKLALSHGLYGELVKSIDERGLALQRLGRAEQTIPIHKRAVEFARKRKLPTQLRTSLNNLGQAYWRLGRCDEATKTLRESEEMSRTAGDYKDALGTMVNRGIALQERGECRAAGTILRKCTAEAERREHWREYVMAQEALGNLAWHQHRLKEAETHYRNGHAIAKKRGVKDSEAEIAVNYASLLETMGNSKQALGLLGAYESEFSTIIDPHVCYDVLAGLYLENGHREAARRNWKTARSFAQSCGNADYIACCSANLAGLYESENQYDVAARELEVALAQKLNPKLRVRLLSDLLRVELLLGNEEKAGTIFSEAHRIAQKHRLSDVLIDLHLWVGDYEWRRDLRAKGDALKAYVAAIVTALSEPGFESLPKVSGHIVNNLTNPRHLPTDEEFTVLIKGLKSDLPTLKDRDQDIVSVVLWPFEIARKLRPFVGDKERYIAELIKVTKNGIPSASEARD